MKQFRQPRQLVGPDSRPDRRGNESDDEPMYVTEEENLFQSSYEEFEESEDSSSAKDPAQGRGPAIAKKD